MEDLIDSPDPMTYSAAKILNPKNEETVVLCSSGTTGFPKGVMLSHSNMLAYIYNMP